jgi:DNA-binding IscR family transcriptional regulator
VHDRWKAVREAYIRFLQDTTVADLAGRVARKAARR